MSFNIYGGDIEALEAKVKSLNLDILAMKTPPITIPNPANPGYYKPNQARFAWNAFKLDWTAWAVRWHQWYEAHDNAIEQVDVPGVGESMEAEIKTWSNQFNTWRQRFVEDFGGSTKVDAMTPKAKSSGGDLLGTGEIGTTLLVAAAIIGGAMLLSSRRK